MKYTSHVIDYGPGLSSKDVKPDTIGDETWV